MTIGELKAKLSQVDDSCIIVEIARVVRENVPLEPVVGLSCRADVIAAALPGTTFPPLARVGSDQVLPWPRETTPGELTLSVVDYRSGVGERHHVSVGTTAGIVWK